MAARLPDQPPEVLDVHLVPMRRRHLRSVQRIETQVYPRPWSLSLFMSELALRASRAYFVARAEGVVVGYAGLMFVGEDAHVTTIAVDPAFQRHKVATRLMGHLFREATRRDCDNLTLEVRTSNTGAQAIYKRFGFVEAGLRKNYYVETNEDALVMWANGIRTSEFQANLVAIAASVPGETTFEDIRPNE